MAFKLKSSGLPFKELGSSPAKQGELTRGKKISKIDELERTKEKRPGVTTFDFDETLAVAKPTPKPKPTPQTPTVKPKKKSTSGKIKEFPHIEMKKLNQNGEKQFKYGVNKIQVNSPTKQKTAEKTHVENLTKHSKQIKARSAAEEKGDVLTANIMDTAANKTRKGGQAAQTEAVKNRKK